jgi:D-alanyl-D-alanine carboxypeptidase (penicillin-binding protein 5/6)
MFEPVPDGPIERPSSEQGDGEQDGLRVVLTDGPPTATPYTVQGRMPPVPDVVPPTRRAATPPKKAAPKKTRGNWAIQAGAFKSKSQAREQLALIQRRFASAVDDGEAAIGSAVGGYFRVRFEGMTADAARSACKALKAKKQTCMVIEP